MKKNEVRIGATHMAKVSGEVVPVTILEEKWKGERHAGWVGTNARTGRPVHIKSATRLRREVGGAGEAGESRKADRPMSALDAAAKVLADAGVCGLLW